MHYQIQQNLHFHFPEWDIHSNDVPICDTYRIQQVL